MRKDGIGKYNVSKSDNWLLLNRTQNRITVIMKHVLSRIMKHVLSRAHLFDIRGLEMTIYHSNTICIV